MIGGRDRQMERENHDRMYMMVTDCTFIRGKKSVAKRAVHHHGSLFPLKIPLCKHILMRPHINTVTLQTHTSVHEGR